MYVCMYGGGAVKTDCKHYNKVQKKFVNIKTSSRSFKGSKSSKFKMFLQSNGAVLHLQYCFTDLTIPSNAAF